MAKNGSTCKDAKGPWSPSAQQKDRRRAPWSPGQLRKTRRGYAACQTRPPRRARPPKPQPFVAQPYWKKNKQIIKRIEVQMNQ